MAKPAPHQRYSIDLLFARRLALLVWLALTDGAEQSINHNHSNNPIEHKCDDDDDDADEADENRALLLPRNANSRHRHRHRRHHHHDWLRSFRSRMVAALLSWCLWIPVMLVLISFASLFLGNEVGKLPGRFYMAIIDRSSSEMWQCMWQGVIWIGIISLVTAIESSLEEIFALVWRRSLTLALHRLYFANDLFYRTTLGIGSSSNAHDNHGGNDTGDGSTTGSWTSRIRSRLRLRRGHSQSNNEAESTSNDTKEQKNDSVHAIDNPDQRIAADVNSFATSFAQILHKSVSSPLIIVYYSSATFNFLGWKGPLLCYGFFVFGFILNKLLMGPLVPLIFRQELLEGNFRFSHVFLRTHAESVAFYRGQDRERALNTAHFLSAVSNQWRVILVRLPLYMHEKLFGYFGAVLNYFIIAYLVFVEKAFSGLSPGEMSFTVQQASFSCLMLIFGFTQFIQLGADISSLAGFTARIGEFWQVMQHINRKQESPSEQKTNSTATSDEEQAIGRTEDPSLGTMRVTTIGAHIEFKNVTCFNPNLQILVKNVNFSVRGPQDSLLVMGPSGCGKTSLLRILGGLWPYYRGLIIRPEVMLAPECTMQLFYIPQQPYINLGTLRDQITYPLEGNKSPASDEQLSQILDIVFLGSLPSRVGGFDTIANLPEILSPGEKQRLAFARLFFHKPRFAVLDEATSALSIEMEEALYSHCLQLGVALISCGHRPSLLRFHAQLLRLGIADSGDSVVCGSHELAFYRGEISATSWTLGRIGPLGRAEKEQ